MRNTLGAHYHELADSISIQEVEDASRATLSLWDALRCPTCGRIAKRKNGPNGKWSPAFPDTCSAHAPKDAAP